MPAIHYFEIDMENSVPFFELKKDKSISTPYQLSISPEIDNDVHTTLVNLGASENSGFHKYTIYHEEYRKISGRYQNNPIHYYISIEKLDLFKALNKNYLIIKANNQDIIDNTVRKLMSFDLLKVKYYTLNLQQFIGNFQNIELTNIWKTKIKEKSLQSIAFYGPFILDSDLWIEYKNDGEISSIRIKVNFDGEPVSLTLSKNGNISFYRSFSELELLDKMMLVIHELKKYMVPSE